MEAGLNSISGPGSDVTHTVRPGFKGWLDVIRGLRHNPVYHHIRRLRTRRTLSVPWYKRNPVVFLLVAVMVPLYIYAEVSAPHYLPPATPGDYLELAWGFIRSLGLTICTGWLVQAMYRYAHDTLGLLGRYRDRRLESTVGDDLAVATLDDREVLAGAFWAHYRALLPALAVVSLADYHFNIGYYAGYAPREVPDWLVTAFIHVATGLGELLTSCLAALVLGLLLVILGCNLGNPRLQPITGALVAFLTLMTVTNHSPGLQSGMDAWSYGMSVALARLILVTTALCCVAVVLALVSAALKSAGARRSPAWLAPVVAGLVSGGSLLLSYFKYHGDIQSLMALKKGNLLVEYLLVLGSAFRWASPFISVIPLSIYAQSHFYYVVARPDTSARDYLWVAWWYFPVVTAVQLLLVAGLARLGAAAVALRRKAVD